MVVKLEATFKLSTLR